MHILFPVRRGGEGGKEEREEKPTDSSWICCSQGADFKTIKQRNRNLIKNFIVFLLNNNNIEKFLFCCLIVFKIRSQVNAEGRVSEVFQVLSLRRLPARMIEVVNFKRVQLGKVFIFLRLKVCFVQALFPWRRWSSAPTWSTSTSRTSRSCRQHSTN